MAAAELQVFEDFTQGDDFITKISHNPVIDLTGATFEVYLKASEDGEPILFVSYPVPAGADASGGIAYIPVSKADTSAVPAGRYYGSIKRILANGDTKTLIRTGKNNARKVICYKNLKNT